jgi:putative FmdB family regulatory protein
LSSASRLAPSLKSTAMPVYEYEHCDDSACAMGVIFEIRQSLDAAPLTRCPDCQAPVRKLISRPNISTPRGNAQLKDMGFTKLVRRDDGVYENVTARPGDSRYVLRDQPATLPDLSKTIRD